MPTPKEVFDNPEKYWEFLTAVSDADFEGQYFERKDTSDHDEVKETVSAFANRSGGLLVLGISPKGEVRGIDHLADDKRNRLTNINALLTGQSASGREGTIKDASGALKKIYLIYVPESRDDICETIGSSPKGWRRDSGQNILMNDAQREQMKRDKRIVNFEQAYCCAYNPADVDRDVLDEFRRAYLTNASYAKTDEELLYQAGALGKDASGYYFTKAGLLFFASNPQRVLPWAYLRLLKFEATSENWSRRGLPSNQKPFAGSITKQIRDVRTFFKESGFFKQYPIRERGSGRIVEEPELPVTAVGEAIVNAVAHRDYAINLPIECEAYKDAFVVHNPGRILQREHDVPSEFTLENTILDQYPRNPKLIEWLKIMPDEHGAVFVLGLREGTR
jgi:predicted HTH transcriptional regulator